LGFDCCAKLGALSSDADRSEAPITAINRRPQGASFIDTLHDQLNLCAKVHSLPISQLSPGLEVRWQILPSVSVC
jgi:hypothetical protein